MKKPNKKKDKDKENVPPKEQDTKEIETSGDDTFDCAIDKFLGKPKK